MVREMNLYKAEEFTLSSYTNLLNLTKKKFVFRNYNNFRSDENFVLWRHDVDLSLEQALVIAQIEAELNITSTFFIHLHNEFYNLLDQSSQYLVKELISLDRAIGLHFDVNYYSISSTKELNKWLAFEKNVLEAIFDIKINVFSFHNTNRHTEFFEESVYAEMINTYSSYFKNKISYCSDSNGYWRFKKLQDVISDDEVKQLQVLTHPGWWTENELLPREKVSSYVQNRADSTMRNYDDILKKNDRCNLR